jgi:hypothetical protein
MNKIFLFLEEDDGDDRVEGKEILDIWLNVNDELYEFLFFLLSIHCFIILDGIRVKLRCEMRCEAVGS